MKTGHKHLLQFFVIFLVEFGAIRPMGRTRIFIKQLKHYNQNPGDKHPYLLDRRLSGLQNYWGYYNEYVYHSTALRTSPTFSLYNKK